MTVDLRYLIALAAYVLVFTIAVLGYAGWRARQRKERWPIAIKLLRAPGESVRRRTRKLEDSLFWRIYLAAVAPILLGIAVIVFLAKTAPTTRIDLGLAIAGVVTVAGSIISGGWAWKHARNLANHHMAQFGERVVAEHLQPLTKEGYSVLHDIPAEGRKKNFNLDHVTVGPTGVAAVETKTFRKRRGLPGREEHKVDFDGNRLVWPWGENRHGLDQAKWSAEWLQDWIKTRTGLSIPVRAVLTFPGWYVTQSGRGPIAVVDVKHVRDAVKGRGERVLSDEQIKLVALQLDAICRDVED